MGEEEGNAVVDRDHRRDEPDDRGHIVRRVEQIDTQAPHLERDGELLPYGVAGRSVDDGDEVLSEIAERQGVCPVAQ